jgi:F-type H+-transporting ATPase subunit epsilon
MSEITAFKLKIVTPHGVRLDEEAAFASLNTDIGQMGIMPNHTPSLVTMVPGELAIRATDGKTTASYFVPEGIAQIKETEVLLVIPYVEGIHEIDKNRAESALARAKQRLNARSGETDLNRRRAELAFSRADNRLKLLAKSLV